MASLRTKLSSPTGSSVCAARRCAATIDRGKLFCPECWAILPPKYRWSLVNAYTPRQEEEDGPEPVAAWYVEESKAIAAVERIRSIRRLAARG